MMLRIGGITYEFSHLHYAGHLVKVVHVANNYVFVTRKFAVIAEVSKSAIRVLSKKNEVHQTRIKR